MDPAGEVPGVKLLGEGKQAATRQDPMRQFLAGGFDTLASTTVYWLDVNGATIGTQTNQITAGDPSYYEPMIAPRPAGG